MLNYCSCYCSCSCSCSLITHPYFLPSSSHRLCPGLVPTRTESLQAKRGGAHTYTFYSDYCIAYSLLSSLLLSRMYPSPPSSRPTFIQFPWRSFPTCNHDQRHLSCTMNTSIRNTRYRNTTLYLHIHIVIMRIHLHTVRQRPRRSSEGIPLPLRPSSSCSTIRC